MENRKIPLLTASDIEVKIKQCTEKGAVALLYKTARVDMAILDQVYGADNWECDYKEIKGNLYCGIGVRTGENQPFVWKWDCGIESREDDEGNQKKGEASDAFKRAGFKWGIGRELYTAPFTFLAVPTKESGKKTNGKPTYELANRFTRYECQSLEYEDGKITKVVIVDSDGVVVYPKGGSRKPTPKPDVTPDAEPSENTAKATNKAPAKTSTGKSKYATVCDAIEGTNKTVDMVTEWCEKKFGVARINNLTDEQFATLMGALTK